MRSRIIYISISLVLFIFTMPLILGIVVKHNINSSIIKLSDKYNGDNHISPKLTFALVEINTGWFSSTAKIKGTIFPAKYSWFSWGSSDGSPFIIDTKINHAPLLLKSDIRHASKIGAASASSFFTLDISNDKKDSLPIEIATKVSLFGNYHHFLKFPGHKHHLSTFMDIEWLDADIELSHSRELTDIDLNIDVDNVNISHRFIGRFTFKDLNFHKASSKTDEEYFASHLIIDEISAFDIGGHKIRIDEFSHEMIVSRDKDQLTDIYMFLNFEKLASTFGDLKTTFFGVKMNNFDFHSISKLKEELKTKDAVVTNSHFYSRIRDSITKSSTILIEPFKFNSSKGDVQISGKLSPTNPWPEKITDVDNMWDLAENVDLSVVASEDMTKVIVEYALKLIKRNEVLKTANRTKPAKFVNEPITITAKEVSLAMKKWEKSGLLKISSDQYTLNFNYADKIFSINGNKL